MVNAENEEHSHIQFASVLACKIGLHMMFFIDHLPVAATASTLHVLIRDIMIIVLRFFWGLCTKSPPGSGIHIPKWEASRSKEFPNHMQGD